MIHQYDFPRMNVVVDIVVIALSEDSILLIKRGKEPYKDYWALPGGFVEMNETTEHAARRELHEETGLVAYGPITQLKVRDAIDRDPRDRTISIPYLYTTYEFPVVQAGDDANDVMWLPIHKLSSTKLAFDHLEIIKEAKEYLNSWLDVKVNL